MILHGILGALAGLSLALLVWQWLAARRFPLHRRRPALSPAPAVTLLKPLKGCDPFTENCLRSWLAQAYPGPVQVLFGVASADDPVCPVVERLLREFPQRDAQLVVCPAAIGPNAKVSKLAQLEPLAKHERVVVSDADVRAPLDLLTNLLPLLDQPAPDAAPANPDPSQRPAGLVNCFYLLANPATPALRWEAVAINADFWSQVLQGASFRELDFALGAVMAVRRANVAEIGGFKALADCLADDYQLGHRLAQRGHRIALCPVVVECWSEPMSWTAVWRHQLRWARTIRVCQPLPYFFSILSNATFWPLLWLAGTGVGPSLAFHEFPGGATGSITPLWPWLCAGGCLVIRILAAQDLQRRLTRSGAGWKHFWAVPVKDLLQVVLWAGSFLGDRVEWRGRTYRLRRDGTLVEAAGAG